MGWGGVGWGGVGVGAGWGGAKKGKPTSWIGGYKGLNHQNGFGGNFETTFSLSASI